LLLFDFNPNNFGVNFYNYVCFTSGAIWTKMKTNFEWWEVDIIFRVTGRGRIGADGLVCIDNT
jgi:hypothetical protein